MLTDVSGPADLVFSTHVLMMAGTGSARYKIASLIPFELKEKVQCTLFLPKGMSVTFYETQIDCVTIVRLPEDIFKRALRGVADYDSVLFRAFWNSDDIVLKHACELMRSVALDENPTPPELIPPLLSSIVTRILQHVEGAPHRRSRVITQPHVAVLSKFIDDNLLRPIRLQELAALVGLSQFHFAREFKIATNTSPMRYVLERRVAAAQIALVGSRPLALVALDVGFSSQSHFTTAFRLVTGMTPSAWRAAR